MNGFGVVVLAALVGEYLLSLAAGALNLRALDPAVPREFGGALDGDRYARSQAYSRTRTRFGLAEGAVNLAVVLAWWRAGGFDWLDRHVRALEHGPVVTGLLYVGALGLASAAIGLPFRLWSTFVIEQRFGFNRTTAATFAADLAKGLALAVALGGALLAAVLAFFEWAGALAWLWCWLAAAAFLLAVQFVAPTWIMPLFNTFTPLGPGALRDAILGYARRTDFPVKDVFVVDGSRRSSKANAFFTGVGRNKRIGLFDTLVRDYGADELVAVVAHEVGHYRKGHVLQAAALQIAHLGALFFVLSLVLRQEGLFEAFQMRETSVYAGLVFFGLLFTPVELALSLAVNAVSRRNELQADAFAAETTGGGDALISALKKLSADNLSNLTPHPLHVFLHYSHPPALRRIEALRRLDAQR